MEKDIYKIKLSVNTPVHIGSGKKIHKLNYIDDKNQSKIYVLNEECLIQTLNKEKLRKNFEDYLMGDKDKISIDDFLNRDVKNKNGIKSILKKTAIASISYNNIKGLNEIEEFQKNDFGEIYISGSSLKGSILTACMHKYIMDSNKKWYELDTKALNKEIQALKKKIGSTIRVSDSIKGKFNTYIFQKKDFTTGIENKGEKENDISLGRECIVKGSYTEHEIEIYKNDKGIDKDFIKNALDEFMEYQIDLLKKLNGKYVNNKYSSNIILGGGTGFINKTLCYQTGKNFDKSLEKVRGDLERKFRKHKHLRSDKKLSPRTIKLADNEMMGLCKLEII